MKTKKLVFGLGLALLGGLAHAQNGLENVIVEKYYISNAADATAANADLTGAGYATGKLPAGSVTYRVYADLLTGYNLQAIYGVAAPSHALKVTTTTAFYNNSAGATTANFSRNGVKNTTGSTLGLDSYFALGAAASNAYGILKSEDDVTLGGANLITSVVGNVLQNNAALAGLALTSQDGYYYSGAPTGLAAPSAASFTPGLDASMFNDGSTPGNTFNTTNGSIYVAGGVAGPVASTNKILIGQFTTDGVFEFELNLQVGTPTGGTQNFVAKNPSGSEISIPSLTRAANHPPTVSITAPAGGSSAITGTVVSITANAADTDLGGSVASVQFFVDGTLLSTDNSSPYTASYTGVLGSHNLTARAFDNLGDSATSAIVAITVANNQAPTVSITSPAGGSSYVVGDVVAIAASASDPDASGSVASVQFFVDGSLVGTDNSSPYTFNYTSTLGGHVLTAKATDNLGLQTTSATVNISVLANVPPTVAITAPLSGSSVTAPALVTITANAADSDVGGSVTQVEFFVNNVSVGVDATSPYSLNWTSVIGTANITAKATDNKGAITTSAIVVLTVADPNALPYKVVTTTEKCLSNTFCLPVAAVDTVKNVIGYDLVLHYDITKVAPTGNITVNNALINPSYVDVSNSVDAVNGLITISAFFNTSAPLNTKFTGTGNIFCVEFSKTAGFLSVDTAKYTVTDLLESYGNGYSTKLVQAGKYISYKDSLFTGKLKFWADSASILYNVANPNQYLATNVKGNNTTGTALSTVAVNPDLTGNFVHNIWNGEAVTIQRDILSTTSVQPVVNGFDALLARKLLINDPTFVPTIYQIIALDVNQDGIVSAGDVSQINLRTVLSIPEFKQAWNYSAAGVSNGKPSNDWTFVDPTLLASAAYQKSTTFPLDNGTGFSKKRVPVVPVQLSVPVSGINTCPLILTGNYYGIMLGDVNGSYKNIAADGMLKAMSSTDKVTFDLSTATINNGFITIPVSVTATNNVNALDFSMQFNDATLSYNSIVNHASYAQALDNFNTADKTVRFTSNSFQNYDLTQPIVSVRFATSAVQVDQADLSSLEAYLNGEKVNVEVVGAAATTTGISTVNSDNNFVSIYPNPAHEVLNVMATQNAMVQLFDMTGKQVVFQTNLVANQKQEINTQNIADGVYMMKISNDNIVSIKKVVINNK